MARTKKTDTPLGEVLAASNGTLIIRVEADALGDFKPGDELMLMKREDPIGDALRRGELAEWIRRTA